MTKKKVEKEYWLETIADLEQVPTDKIRYCLQDLELFLVFRRIVAAVTSRGPSGRWRPESRTTAARTAGKAGI